MKQISEFNDVSKELSAPQLKDLEDAFIAFGSSRSKSETGAFTAGFAAALLGLGYHTRSTVLTPFVVFGVMTGDNIFEKGVFEPLDD